MRLHEVKRVAEFVSRKICIAQLGAGKAADAFESFRRHARLFRNVRSALSPHGPLAYRSSPGTCPL